MRILHCSKEWRTLALKGRNDPMYHDIRGRIIVFHMATAQLRKSDQSRAGRTKETAVSSRHNTRRALATPRESISTPRGPFAQHASYSSITPNRTCRLHTRCRRICKLHIRHRLAAAEYYRHPVHANSSRGIQSRKRRNKGGACTRSKHNSK